MDISLCELRSIVGGQARLGSPPPRDGELGLLGPVVIDSREVRPGDIFWALKGRRCNGADFAHEALLRGAQGVIVTDRHVEPWAGAFALEVEDTKLALWQLADWNRRRFSGLVIAVTGSVGKTTARQMIDSVLRPAGPGITSLRNFNNDIGLPLSLLELKPQHDYAVLELAASGPGEIDSLARLSAPQIGVITRIGDAHLGGFGGPAQIAAAKAELLAVLGGNHQAVLCGDDPWLRRLATACQAPILWFGRSGDCEVAATDVHSAEGLVCFRVEGQLFRVPVWGRHFLDAALAAISVGLVYGRSLREIADALADFHPVPMRCEVTDHCGVVVINDAYNSSPLAMRMAFGLLAEYSTTGRRIVLAGDMGELGAGAPALHFEMGKQVVTLAGADRLFACGTYSTQVVEGAVAAGMAPDRAVAIADPLACGECVRETLETGDVLLVKASRAMRLERVVESFASQPAARAA